MHHNAFLAFHSKLRQLNLTTSEHPNKISSKFQQYHKNVNRENHHSSSGKSTLSYNLRVSFQSLFLLRRREKYLALASHRVLTLPLCFPPLSTKYVSGSGGNPSELTDRSITLSCKSSRTLRMWSKVGFPVRSKRTRAVNALKAEMASSSHLSVIHIHTGIAKKVRGASGIVTIVAPNQTHSPDMRPYISLYWAISSHVPDRTRFLEIFYTVCGCEKNWGPEQETGYGDKE